MNATIDVYSGLTEDQKEFSVGFFHADVGKYWCLAMLFKNYKEIKQYNVIEKNCFGVLYKTQHASISIKLARCIWKELLNMGFYLQKGNRTYMNSYIVS